VLALNLCLQFELSTQYRQFKAADFFALLDAVPIVPGIGTVRQHRHHVNDRKIPFLFGLDPDRPDLLIF
jgi:hypothetical protein